MENDVNQKFVEDLIVNLLDIIYSHEDYHDIALTFNGELELKDGRVLTLILGQRLTYA